MCWYLEIPRGELILQDAQGVGGRGVNGKLKGWSSENLNKINGLSFTRVATTTTTKNSLTCRECLAELGSIPLLIGDN